MYTEPTNVVSTTPSTTAPLVCQEDPNEYKWALYAFVGLFVYSCILLLGMALFLVVYRPYLRFLFRKKPVHKPGMGMTVDETITTMGVTDVSAMTPPTKTDTKNAKTDEKTPTKSPNSKKSKEDTSKKSTKAKKK